MATTKVTITLDDTQLEAIRALVSSGRASSISGFIQHAVRVGLHDVAGWKDMLESALQQSGGPLTKKERAWADALLTAGPRKGRGTRRSAA